MNSTGERLASPSASHAPASSAERPPTAPRAGTSPRESRAWWWPLVLLGIVASAVSLAVLVLPIETLPPGSSGWWLVTVALHAPFVAILVFLLAGFVERVGYFLRGHSAEVAGSLPHLLPRVCVQLPMFNEAAVAGRAIAAAGALDWPRDRFEIQVLDDSTDPEARARVDGAAAILQAAGVTCTVIRRTTRTGYKAGALEEGRLRTGAEYLAILDADFVPHPDFLMRAVPYFYSEDASALADVAVVQARWAHLNGDESALTRAQSLWVDDHHVLQMSWRSAMWRFVNFTGTAGVWRAEAIDRAGGWRAASLVEDCELSFRALFAGYRSRFIKEIPVPAELPASHRAYLAQQKRWTQLQRLHAVTLLRDYPAGPIRRLHLAYHMGISWQWPLWGIWMLLLPVLVNEQLWLGAQHPAVGFAVYVAPVLGWLVFSTAAATAEIARIDGRNGIGAVLRGVFRIVPYGLLNSGALPHQVTAFCEGLLGPLHSEFVRTPKTGSRGSNPAESGVTPPRRSTLKAGDLAALFFVLYQLVWAAAFATQGLVLPAAIALVVAMCVVFVTTATPLRTTLSPRT